MVSKFQPLLRFWEVLGAYAAKVTYEAMFQPFLRF